MRTEARSNSSTGLVAGAGRQSKSANIESKLDTNLSAGQVVDLLRDSTVGERRPIEGREGLEGMVRNSNRVDFAWDREHFRGRGRSMTGFHYGCYLSVLAIDKIHQNRGIGR